MHISNNIPNPVDATFADTFASVPVLVGETAVAANIADDDEGGFSDDNGGATGGVNETVDKIMFNVVSDSFHES